MTSAPEVEFEKEQKAGIGASVRKRDGVARKVRVRSSADLNELYPAYTATRVTISTAAGDSFVRTVDVPAGDYRAPLSRQDLLDKFATYTAYRLDEARRDTVVDLLMGHHLDHPVSAVVEPLG